jgi:hypothetical protein
MKTIKQIYLEDIYIYSLTRSQHIVRSVLINENKKETNKSINKNVLLTIH